MEILAASNLRMGKALIDRFFCHYEELEEYKFGMWRRAGSGEFKDKAKKARHFMMNVEAFSEAMGDVCDQWPNSCKSNFTTPSVNPVAWLGQAAVCHAIAVPESCVRAAWCELPATIQHMANAKAKMHILSWQKKEAGQGELFDEV